MPQRQYRSSQLPSQSVFFRDIYAFHRYTTFRLPQPYPSYTVSNAILVKREDFHTDLYVAYAPFKPNNSG